MSDIPKPEELWMVWDHLRCQWVPDEFANAFLCFDDREEAEDCAFDWNRRRAETVAKCEVVQVIGGNS